MSKNTKKANSSSRQMERMVRFSTALITPDFGNPGKWAVHDFDKKLQWGSSSLDLTRQEALKESRKARARYKKEI